MDNSQTYYPAQNRQLEMLLNLVIAAAIIICGLFIFLIIIGYTSVRLDVPNNASVQINDHAVSARLLKMRPGKYQVIISSPLITPYQGTLNVGLFGTTVYKPALEQRSFSAIASSIIGAVGTAGSPQPSLVRWFDSNTWVVGLVVPGNADLALHYEATERQWVVGFYNVAGYTDSLSQLPVSVAAYIQTLEDQHAGG